VFEFDEEEVVVGAESSRRAFSGPLRLHLLSSSETASVNYFWQQSALFIQFISIRRAKLIKSFPPIKARAFPLEERAPRLGASE
jgi:hypothetical protein